MSDIYNNVYPPGFSRPTGREEVPLSPLFASAVRESLGPTQYPSIGSRGLDGIFTSANPNTNFEQIEAFVDQNVQDGKPLPTIFRDHETLALYLAKYQILDDHRIDPFEFKVLSQSAAPYVQAVDYILSKETEPVLLETPIGKFKLGANSLSRLPDEPATAKSTEAETTTEAEKPETAHH